MKKAVVHISILQLIGLILAVALILSSAFFFARIAGWFASKQEYEATTNSFNVLYGLIQDAANDNSPGIVKRDMIGYFISNQYILVGFHKNQDFVEDICDPERAQKIHEACKTTACLCLYPETYGDLDFESTDFPKVCKSLENVEYIYTEKYDANNAPSKIYQNVLGGKWQRPNNPADNFAYFFIYGQCDDWTSDENFGTNNLGISKYVIDGKTYVEISYLK